MASAVQPITAVDATATRAPRTTREDSGVCVRPSPRQNRMYIRTPPTTAVSTFWRLLLELSISLIVTERLPLHRLAKFLSGTGLLLLSLDGGFLVVFPPLHLLEQAILEHQLLQRLERWLNLIVAHVDLHGYPTLWGT